MILSQYMTKESDWISVSRYLDEISDFQTSISNFPQRPIRYNTMMYDSAMYKKTRVDHETMNGHGSSGNEKSPISKRNCREKTSCDKRVLSRVDLNMRVP